MQKIIQKYLSQTECTSQVRAWGSRVGTFIPPPFLKHLLWHPHFRFRSVLPCFNSAWHSAQKSACSALIWISMSSAEKIHLSSPAILTQRARERGRVRDEEDEDFKPEMVTRGSGHPFLKARHPRTSSQAVTWWGNFRWSNSRPYRTVKRSICNF